MDALNDIPKLEGPLQTMRGDAVLHKTDIFRKILWFGYKDENSWFPLNLERVNQILEQNRNGQKPATLEKDHEDQPEAGPLNTDLARLDKKFRNKGRNKKKKNRGPRNQGQSPRPNGQRPQNSGQ